MDSLTLIEIYEMTFKLYSVRFQDSDWTLRLMKKVFTGVTDTGAEWPLSYRLEVNWKSFRNLRSHALAKSIQTFIRNSLNQVFQSLPCPQVYKINHPGSPSWRRVLWGSYPSLSRNPMKEFGFGGCTNSIVPNVKFGDYGVGLFCRSWAWSLSSSKRNS